MLRVVDSIAQNTVAALLLHLCGETGNRPHCYFEWTEGYPIVRILVSWLLTNILSPLAPLIANTL